jgi:hypothetical protein
MRFSERLVSVVATPTLGGESRWLGEPRFECAEPSRYSIKFSN